MPHVSSNGGEDIVERTERTMDNGMLARRWLNIGYCKLQWERQRMNIYPGHVCA